MITRIKPCASNLLYEYRENVSVDSALCHAYGRLDADLIYDEPWGWMVPAEHALGALLLEQGHVEEATEVFR